RWRQWHLNAELCNQCLKHPILLVELSLSLLELALVLCFLFGHLSTIRHTCSASFSASYCFKVAMVSATCPVLAALCPPILFSRGSTPNPFCYLDLVPKALDMI
ncbi:hypothetical protein PanWU01x14_109390, partial [Parasponia andersonii]